MTAIFEMLLINAVVLGISTASALALGHLFLNGLSFLLFSNRQR
jgi:hypothetical protein